MANPIVRAASSVSAVAKKFTMSFGAAWGSIWADDGTARSWANWARNFGSSRFDYASQTDPNANSIVMSCVLWICRTFPEAPLYVMTDRPDGTQEPIRRHPLTDLLRRPNDYYSGILLWYASLTDLLTTGNAYWVKVRSAAGRVVELWWVPQYMLQPRWPTDGSAFLSYYEYRPDGFEPIRVEVLDVVHFRYGLDPVNVRKGLSPLASLLHEVYTDDEAARFTSSILRNLGVPGVVLSPGDSDVSVPMEDLERIKSEFQARFGGDRRGEPLVMSGKTQVSVLSFSPRDMDMKQLRMVPEERISAILGIPAAVVGLGAGLERTKVGATMREMREQAYESCIIPMQRLLASELNSQLLPDFADPQNTEIGFDLSKVRVLTADQDQQHARAREGLTSGLFTRNQALLMVGNEAEGPESDVLYIPNTVTVKAPADLLTPPPVSPTLMPPADQPGLPAPKPATNGAVKHEELAIS